MPLSCLCLLICLNPSLPPDATFPVHLHTQTVHSVTDICLAPASGQVVFQAWDSREKTDNNPSPAGAEILPEAKPSYLTPIPSARLPGHSSFTPPGPDALYCPEEPPWTYRFVHCNRSADPLTTTQNLAGMPWVGTFRSSRGLAGHMAPGPCQGRIVWLEQPSLFNCTDLDDCCPGLLPPGQMKVLISKLSFDTEGYWKKRGQESFYPYMGMRVIFTITDENHKFHGLPLLSPWSYTTYRGS
uniref:Transthyretin/hydroxyisourate hydrolase domain-containing protein n=1 Tax=Bos indicus x Bos taurus TaxID=30522 RepID=A0A4W2HKQ5_BOBOX